MATVPRGQQFPVGRIGVAAASAWCEPGPGLLRWVGPDLGGAVQGERRRCVAQPGAQETKVAEALQVGPGRTAALLAVRRSLKPLHPLGAPASRGGSDYR